MSGDRELLELAAKAAGYTKWNDEWWAMCDGENHWDPLRHNGQALKLAVKLNLTLRMHSGNTCAQSGAPGTPAAYVDESNHTDHYAATRRAIVRAAAEIGKSRVSAPGAVEGK